MKNLILIAVIVISALPLRAQTRQWSESKAISKGRIVTTDQEVIEGQHMVVSSDSVQYYVKASTIRYAMGLNEVNSIEEYQGDYGTTGTVVGALVGGGIGLAVALGSKETKSTRFFEETTIQTWPIYAFTLVGGLLGYAIGSNAESWGIVYDSRRAFFDPFQVHANANIGGVSITYRIKL